MTTPIPFDKRTGSIWYDGTFTDWQDANVHVLTHGLHYASSVFEGLRVYDGKIFKLQEHSERLIRSAELLDMVIPYDVDTLNQACIDACAKNNVTNGYLRPVAWSGSEHMAIAARQNTVHVAVAAWEWGTYFDASLKQTGLKLITSTWRRPSPESAPCESKAAGLYMICTMSKHQAERAGYHDALMLDWRGYIAEATGANIFFVMDNKEIHTPTPDCFLNGITRRTVMALAEKAGYTIVERHIKPDILAQAKEVFLTGTAAEVTPVGSIDDHQYTVGDACHRLMDDYATLVRT